HPADQSPMTQKTIRSTVERIIREVRADGDAAVVRILRAHDKVKLSARALRVSGGKITEAPFRIDGNVRRAMEACARRIQDFHYQEERHIPQSCTFSKAGVHLGQIYNPIETVGFYVPGGLFAYPSTVLMTAIPARLAGVNRIVIATPPGRITDELLAAASMA